MAIAGNATFVGSVFGPSSGSGTLKVTGHNALTFDSSISASNLTLTLGGASVGLTNNGVADYSQALHVYLGDLTHTGINVTVGTIHITGDTILDFGNSAGTVLSSVNLIVDQGVNVQVDNWKTVLNNGTNNTAANSTVWYVLATQTGTGVASGGLVSGSAGNLTLASGGSDAKNVAPLTQITFNNPQGSIGSTTTWVDGFHDGWFDHEIRPTPEPTTYGAIFMTGCLGVLGVRQLRRRRAANPTQG